MGTNLWKNKESLEIEKEIDILNVYVCGNNKELKKYNKKEIEGEMDFEKNLPYFESKHPINNWYFNFYSEEISEEFAKNIMNNIIQQYKNKNPVNNNLILIFLDSQKEKENNRNSIKIFLDILEKTNKVYRPILLFSIKKEKEDEKDEEEKNIIDDVIQNTKYNKNILKKYVEFAYYKEDDYSQINKKISSICCYFNNISDIFSILDEMIRGSDSYHPKRKNKIIYYSTFNILVIGRPGSGKSTLINLLLNERKAREGIGTSVTKIVSRYIHDQYPISFQDTPGFEDNNDLKKMINFLSDSQKIFKEGKNKFHLVLYLINASNERSFIGEEILLINYIKDKMKLPIFFVCTKSRNEKYAEDFEEVLKLNLWQNFGNETNLVDHIYSCHLLNEKDGVYKRFGIDKLLNSIQIFYEKELKEREINLVNNDNISTKNNEKPIFLGDLKNSKDFENYLYNLSDDIIKNYQIYTYNKLQTNKKDKRNEKNKKIILDFDIINEMLVDHLALELNGKSCGNSFCKKNKVKVVNNVKEEMVEDTSYGCFKKKSSDLKIGEISVNDEDFKKTIKITKEYGEEAKKEFLEDLKKNGLENYLKNIIDNYKKAIESLPNLSEDMEK